MWAKYYYQVEYNDFIQIITLLAQSPKYEPIYSGFLSSEATKQYFEALSLTNQLDFIHQCLQGYENGSLKMGDQTLNDQDPF
jgi:hypothetical protein